MTSMPCRVSRFAARSLTLALVTGTLSCTIFDTEVKNPNAVEEGALGDPASAVVNQSCALQCARRFSDALAAHAEHIGNQLLRHGQLV